MKSRLVSPLHILKWGMKALSIRQLSSTLGFHVNTWKQKIAFLHFHHVSISSFYFKSTWNGVPSGAKHSRQILRWPRASLAPDSKDLSNPVVIFSSSVAAPSSPSPCCSVPPLSPKIRKQNVTYFEYSHGMTSRTKRGSIYWTCAFPSMKKSKKKCKIKVKDRIVQYLSLATCSNSVPCFANIIHVHVLYRSRGCLSRQFKLHAVDGPEITTFCHP